MKHHISGLGRVIVILLFIISSFPDAAAAVPGQKSVSAVPADGVIKIDGVLSEPVWQGEGVSGFTQKDPLDGQPETEKTTVWVAYDADYLYVAARLTDRDPKGIVSRLGRRDDEVESDWFYFGIDPYYDKRSGYFFAVNPSGGIMDGILYNDENEDATWDGIWESTARIDEQAGPWSCGFRSPSSGSRKRMNTFGASISSGGSSEKTRKIISPGGRRRKAPRFAVRRADRRSGIDPAAGLNSCLTPSPVVVRAGRSREPFPDRKRLRRKRRLRFSKPA
jgi:hypothetical protein